MVGTHEEWVMRSIRSGYTKTNTIAMKRNLNMYGNEFGFHSPKKTKQAFEALTLAGFECEDTSWHNDLCDSISFKNKQCYLYIPNAEVSDFENEEFATYNVCPLDEEGGLIEPYCGWMFNTIEEVIECINKMPNAKLKL